MKEKPEADRYEENKETYLGMEIGKAIDSDSEGIILGPNNYEGEINKIGIPHARTRRRNGALSGEGQSILRSGLGESM